MPRKVSYNANVKRGSGSSLKYNFNKPEAMCGDEQLLMFTSFPFVFNLN